MRPLSREPDASGSVADEAIVVVKAAEYGNGDDASVLGKAVPVRGEPRG